MHSTILSSVLASLAAIVTIVAFISRAHKNKLISSGIMTMLFLLLMVYSYYMQEPEKAPFPSSLKEDAKKTANSIIAGENEGAYLANLEAIAGFYARYPDKFPSEKDSTKENYESWKMTLATYRNGNKDLPIGRLLELRGYALTHKRKLEEIARNQ